jgi:hypothetical protein
MTAVAAADRGSGFVLASFAREGARGPPLRSGGGGPCEAWWRGRGAEARCHAGPLSRLCRQLPRKRGSIRASRFAPDVEHKRRIPLTTSPTGNNKKVIPARRASMMIPPSSLDEGAPTGGDQLRSDTPVRSGRLAGMDAAPAAIGSQPSRAGRLPARPSAHRRPPCQRLKVAALSPFPESGGGRRANNPETSANDRSTDREFEKIAARALVRALIQSTEGTRTSARHPFGGTEQETVERRRRDGE